MFYILNIRQDLKNRQGKFNSTEVNRLFIISLKCFSLGKRVAGFQCLQRVGGNRGKE